MSKSALDVIKILGLEAELKDGISDEEFETVVKTAAGSKFIDKELHVKEIDAAVGKIKGETETKLRIILGDEAKDKGYYKLLEMAQPAIEAKFTALNDEIKSLRENGGKNTPSDVEKKLTDLQKELTGYVELAGKKDARIQELETALAAKDTEYSTKEKLNKLATIWDKMPFVKDTSSYTKNGIWRDEIEPKFDFKEVDGVMKAYDKEGKPYTGETTSHLSAEEVFKAVMLKAGVYVQNGTVGRKEGSEIKGTDTSKIENPVIRNNMNKALAHSEKLRKAGA